MKRKQRKRSCARQFLVLFVCFLLVLSNIQLVSAEETVNRTVKAGVFSFDGYHMQDESGAYTGYGIELLNLISQYSHLNFEYVGYDKSWKEMQEMLQRGEIDVVTSARKTRQRAELFAFSDPIEQNSTVLSVQGQNTKILSGDYRTYEGMTVGILTGSSQNQSLVDFAKESGFTYQAREYSDSGQMEADLQSGAIDAILTSSLRRAENEKILDTIKIDYFYAITRKEDQELLAEINYAIGQMNASEGDWADVLYHKYYGDASLAASAFTQREIDYIQAVASGEKHITVTSSDGRKPYSYVENGELRGIQPEFFDRLMQMAGLPYEMIVPKDREEYDQLKEDDGVDVVLDWMQSAYLENDYVTDGFLTDTYMNTGTALLTRKNFGAAVSSLSVVAGQEGLVQEHEKFKNAQVLSCPTPQDAVQAVLDGKADAAFLRTYAAQYLVNNDRTNSLRFEMLDSEQVEFNIYIRSSSDHELVTILNKCIRQVPDDVLSQLIASYTAGTLENMSFIRYMSAHPEMAFLLSALVVLAVGTAAFFYMRARWRNKLLQTTRQAKQEVEEQLAIVNALSRDYLNVYTVNMQKAVIRIVKSDGSLTPGTDWKDKGELPYTRIIHQYIENWVSEEEQAYLAEALSLERVKEAMAAGAEYTGTYHVQAGEESHSYQFTYVSYRTESQEIPQILAGFRNIDEIVRKEQEQKALLENALHMAQAANTAKTSFLSNVSHDIRTPMNAIIGFLTLMRDEADRPDAVREYIERIDAASQHLLGLINDVLDMNKIESGSTTLSLADMNLAEVIEEINTIIRPQAEAKNQDFDIISAPLTYGHLLGDKMRINQILINLLSNSVKYTPENGSIVMRIEELPQAVDDYTRIRFTVSDTGLGMSENFLKVIFDPFTREDTQASHEIQGTGLGMAITKSLVDLMGGSIKVESELGKGSTFAVELELRIQEQEDDPKLRAEHRNTRMTAADDVRQRSDVVKDKHILVVDDIEVNRIILIKILSSLGAACDTAANGCEAVEKFEGSSPDGYDLILMDVQMPKMNGYEATRAIRAGSHPSAKTVPIIAMTANAFADDVRDAIASGMDAHIAKPVQIDILKATIQEVFDSRAGK